MPNPTEVCRIIVGGQQYTSWKSVTVNRNFEGAGPFAEVSILEVDLANPSGAAQQIVVGAPCQVLLGGILVLDGFIQVRQAAYTPQAHGLMIRAINRTVLTAKSSVSTNPGQFKNQTISQISNSILSPLGIVFKYIEGVVPPLAEKTFDRVSLNVGETIFAAIARLAWMRNLFLTGDENGNIIAMRPSSSGGVFAQLIEGGNIKSANAILSNMNVGAEYNAQGQNHGTDHFNGRNAAAISAQATSFGEPGTFRNIVMPMMGDAQDAQMVANRQTVHDVSTSSDVQIVTAGWFVDDSTLWIQGLGKKVAVTSPMLFPASFDQNKTPLYLRSVTHRQSDASGTETEISLGLWTDLDSGGFEPPANSTDQGPLNSAPGPAAAQVPN